MNIRVKAALEVTVGILAVLAVVTGIKYILLTATAAYGAEAVINGILFVVMSTTAYVLVGLLYDYRVTQLKYKEKLQEMTKKG